MNKYAALFLYGLLCGAMLVGFAMIQDFTKYIFSLASLYIGYKFFQKYDSIKLRIALIVLALVFFFMGILIVTGIALTKGWEIPGITDNL